MCEVPDSRPWGAGHRGAQRGTGIPGHLTRVLDLSWVLSPALPDEEGGDACSCLPQKCQGCLRALWTCGLSLPPGLPSWERQKDCRDFPCWSWPDQEPCLCGAEDSKLGTTVATVTANTWVHTVPALLCPAPGGSEPWGMSGLGSPGRSANATECRSPARGRTRTEDSQ